jgi:hypothetical protein
MFYIDFKNLITLHNNMNIFKIVYSTLSVFSFYLSFDVIFAYPSDHSVWNKKSGSCHII